jgi:deoxycytidylate deaminase
MKVLNTPENDVEMLRMALDHAGTWSKDPSTKVGCIVEYPDDSAPFLGIVRMGFHNTFEAPAGFDPLTATREERYASVLHAEEDALMEVGGQNSRLATFYVSAEPCGSCWRRLARYAARVVYLETDEVRRERWACQSGLDHASTRVNENGETIEITRYTMKDLGL